MDTSKIRLIAFDLDGTLTQHKTPLDDENRAVLDALGKKYKLLMAGAGMCRRIFNQMGQYPIDILGNYGMQ
ncbi:MAG: phosphomannomutase, partial [Oscillospiraceae bacterium]|nr:phosphomannomutase [Oscillospiraceae bacterium]